MMIAARACDVCGLVIDTAEEHLQATIFSPGERMIVIPGGAPFRPTRVRIAAAHLRCVPASAREWLEHAAKTDEERFRDAPEGLA